MGGGTYDAVDAARAAAGRRLGQATAASSAGNKEGLPFATAVALTRLQQLTAEDVAATAPDDVDVTRAVSPRNEAATLAHIFSNYEKYVGSSDSRRLELLDLCATYCARTGAPQAQEAERATAVLRAPASGAQQQQQVPAELASAEKLYSSCVAAGMSTKLAPATFGAGSLRGLAAVEDVAAGEVVLRLPTSSFITYATARESSLGVALRRIPGLQLHEETLALLWTMVERHDDESPHSAFWASLPQRLYTGLTVSDTELDVLRGSPCYAECVSARAHLAEQHAALSGVTAALVTAYPQHLTHDMFTLDAFSWAAALWYGYAIEVQLRPGEPRQACLVPYLCLANHSPWPHVVHFSRPEPDGGGVLAVRTMRPMSGGQQAFLSYGPLPNAKLLSFYGFAVPHNPCDSLSVTLTAEALAGPLAEARAAAGEQFDGGGVGRPPAGAEEERAVGRKGQKKGMEARGKRGVEQLRQVNAVLAAAGLDGAAECVTDLRPGSLPVPQPLLMWLRVMCASSGELRSLADAVMAAGAASETAGHGGITRAQASAGGGSAALPTPERLLGHPLSARSEAVMRAVLLSAMRRIRDALPPPAARPSVLEESSAAAPSTTSASRHAAAAAEAADQPRHPPAGSSTQASSLFAHHASVYLEGIRDIVNAAIQFAQPAAVGQS